MWRLTGPLVHGAFDKGTSGCCRSGLPVSRSWSQSSRGRSGLASGYPLMHQPAWGITITAGQAESGGHIPKKDLIAKLVVLFEQGRLKIAEELPLAKEVKAELQEFRSRMHASAHVSFEAPVGKHDDLVLALSLAAYPLRHIGEPSRIAPDDTLYP